MTTAISAALLASVTIMPPIPVMAQEGPQRDRDRYADQRRDDDRDHRPRREWRRYDYNHPEPGWDRYDAARYYYRDDRVYHDRRLGRRDRIYRGTDDRYYCRRSDGTTGLIVGGIAGGALGNIVAPGDSKVLGTILGAAGGAAVGRSIDRNNIVCR
jgi:hypothetical protein